MNKRTRITNIMMAGLLMAGLSLTCAAPALAQDEVPGNAPETAAAETVAPEYVEVNGGVEFKLSEAGGVYTVHMRPNATPGNPNATVSAQVTIKVPRGAAAPSAITALVAGTSWEQTSRNDAPAEAPGSDYVSFSLDFPDGNPRAISWVAGTVVPVFSFQAGAGVHLMDNCDAFAVPNSASASVGNEVTVVGLGAEGASAFIGNYDQAPDCPTEAQYKSAIKLEAKSSAGGVVKAGDPVTYTFKIANSGLRTAGSLRLQVTQTGRAETQLASNTFGAANPVLNPNGAATWSLGALAPNASGSVTLVMAAPAGNDKLTMAISISAANDNDAADNTAQIVTDVLVGGRPDYRAYLPLITR